MKARMRKVLVVGVGLLCALMILLLVALVLVRPPAEAVFLPAEEAFKEPNLLRRTAWKVRDALGKRRQFSILVEVLRIESAEKTGAAVGRDALAETTGTKVWILNEILNDEEMNRIGPFRKEDKIATPRMITASSGQGSVFIGSAISVDGTNKPVGIEVRVLPRWRSGNTDFTMGFASTEVRTNQVKGAAQVEVVTNAMFALRVQLPVGKRIFAVAKGQDGKPGTLVSVTARPIEK